MGIHDLLELVQADGVAQVTAAARLDFLEACSEEARDRATGGWPTSHDVEDQANTIASLVAALRAVLAVHAPNGMPVNLCREDRLPYDLCPTVRAITAALDGAS